MLVEAANVGAVTHYALGRREWLAAVATITITSALVVL